MTHFYHSRGIFLDRTEESRTINGRDKEYVTYDYDFNQDIYPYLMNMFYNKKMKTPRKLENIEILRRNQAPMIVFRDFEFMDEKALNKIFGVTSNSGIAIIIFINCRFGGTVIDVPAFGIGLYDCIFEDRIEFDIPITDGLHHAELKNCTFNGQFHLGGGYDQSHSLVFTDCIFNENSTFKADYYRNFRDNPFDRLEMRNCIFKGDVNFANANIPEYSVFEYLTFYREVNFNETKLGENIIFKNVCFAPFVNKATKDGFRSFVKALNDNGYKKEAKFYETHYGDAEAKKVDKTEYDIAVDSGWLNIKQAALFLGVKYSSLLDMRKDDKILGVQRIPFVGEGKNSRYYVPLLKAYKDKDMKKVAELEKEMRQKEKEL